MSCGTTKAAADAFGNLLGGFVDLKGKLFHIEWEDIQEETTFEYDTDDDTSDESERAVRICRNFGLKYREHSPAARLLPITTVEGVLKPVGDDILCLLIVPTGENSCIPHFKRVGCAVLNADGKLEGSYTLCTDWVDLPWQEDEMERIKLY